MIKLTLKVEIQVTADQLIALARFASLVAHILT